MQLWRQIRNDFNKDFNKKIKEIGQVSSGARFVMILIRILIRK